MDPCFDLTQAFTGLDPDLIIGVADANDCLPVFGTSSAGKDFVAFLQEYDDPEPLGRWACLLPIRDFEAYGFDLAQSRGLVLCATRINGTALEMVHLTSAGYFR